MLIFIDLPKVYDLYTRENIDIYGLPLMKILDYVIPAKPLHNHEIVSVHFNHFIAQRFATN